MRVYTESAWWDKPITTADSADFTSISSFRRRLILPVAVSSLLSLQLLNAFFFLPFSLPLWTLFILILLTLTCSLILLALVPATQPHWIKKICIRSSRASFIAQIFVEVSIQYLNQIFKTVSVPIWVPNLFT